MDLKKDQIDLNTVTLDLNWDDINAAASDPYVFTDMSVSGVDTITLGSGTTVMPNVYISNSTTGPSWNGTLWGNDDIKPKSTLTLTGEDADIDINGVSLMETLRGIQDRLNVLRPNPELESEWDELRAVGDRYRELERQFQEKSKMWKTLKDMPPPEIE